MRSSRVRPSREAGEEATDTSWERLGVDGPELILLFADYLCAGLSNYTCVSKPKGRCSIQANQGMHVIDTSFGQVLPASLRQILIVVMGGLPFGIEEFSSTSAAGLDPVFMAPHTAPSTQDARCSRHSRAHLEVLRPLAVKEYGEALLLLSFIQPFGPLPRIDCICIPG